MQDECVRHVMTVKVDGSEIEESIEAGSGTCDSCGRISCETYAIRMKNGFISTLEGESCFSCLLVRLLNVSRICGELTRRSGRLAGIPESELARPKKKVGWALDNQLKRAYIAHVGTHHDGRARNDTQ